MIKANSLLHACRETCLHAHLRLKDVLKGDLRNPLSKQRVLHIHKGPKER